MDTLGVGVIGFGFMGKVHTFDYRSIPLYYDPAPVRVKLVGVAEINQARADKAAEQGGFEVGVTDWRELIARDDIHIIDICSPNSQHPEQLLAAMAAGKHVYCDKPLVVGEADIARVEAALPAYRGTAQLALQYRFFPAVLRARQLIDEGFLGNIVSFRAAYLHSGSVDRHKPMGWKQFKSEGGGVLQDLGSHVLDLLTHLIGPFDSILAQTKIIYPERPNGKGEMVSVEADDQMLMIAKLPTGAMGTLEASKLATGAEDEMRFEIHGDQGALRFNCMDPNYLEAYDLRDPESPLGGQRGWCKIASVQRFEKPGGFPGPKFSIGWIRAHMHSLYNFLEAIANGATPEPSLAHGLYMQRALAIAEHSAQTSTWQQLPQYCRK
ncbi:MAG TPA: Gfo/Idh/MocA family oxidoreductase [Armatimonadota bacterium]|jgi:predicted dehydrogenase